MNRMSRTMLQAIAVIFALSSMPSFAGSILMSDLNFDGWDEVIRIQPDGSLVVLYNQTNGEFTSQFLEGGRTQSSNLITVGEISSDGNLDIIAVDSLSNKIHVWLGPDFSQHQSLDLASYGKSPACVQVGGTFPRAAAVGFQSGGQVVLVEVTPSIRPTLNAIDQIPVEGSVHGLAWTKDGSDRLAVLTAQTGSRVMILERQGSVDPVWKEYASMAVDLEQPSGLVIGNMDNDFITDLAVWNSKGQLQSFLGNFDNTFRKEIASLSTSGDLTPIDLDLDTIVDWIVFDPETGKSTAQKNTGTFTFEEIALPQPEEPASEIAIGKLQQGVNQQVWYLIQDSQGKERILGVDLQPDVPFDFDFDFPFPQVPSFGGSGENANVFVFAQNAWEEGEPVVLASYRYDDWTRVEQSNQDNTFTVYPLVFGANGLEPVDPVIVANHGLPQPIEAYQTIGNQLQSDFSLFSMAAAKEYQDIHLELVPPSGLYTRPIEVEAFANVEADMEYRIGGGGWNPYNPDETSIVFASDKQIEIHASNANGETQISGRYTFEIPATQDTDGDGIPDIAESEWDLPPLSSNHDSDSDGWNDLDELIRYSDPLRKASVPANRDITSESKAILPLLWSDFDELARQTDPNDADSVPAASGLLIPEYLLSIEAPGKPKQHFQLRFVLPQIETIPLEGGNTTLWPQTDDGWHIRLDGASHHWLKKLDPENPALVYIRYLPALQACWHPAVWYADANNPEDWLERLRMELNSSMVRESEVGFDAYHTALALAFEYWLNQQIAEWRMGEDPIEPHSVASILDTLEEQYGLEEVYGQIQTLIGNDHPWVLQAADIMSQAQSHAIAMHSDDALRNILRDDLESINGYSVDADNAKNALRTLQIALDAIEDRSIQKTGEIRYDGQDILLVVNDEESYRLIPTPSTFPSSTVVTVQGWLMPHDCPANIRPAIRIESIQAVEIAVVSNSADSDNDGLPDQWELYFFGGHSASPNEDPDRDGYSNAEELAGFSHPLDPVSTPENSDTHIYDWLQY